MNLDQLYPNGRPERMRVVTYGHPALRRVSEPVADITPEIRDLAHRMIVTMYENETAGIGLAAPQVGINLRLVTMATQEPDDPMPPETSPGELLLGPRMPIVLVNPRILSFGEERETVSEGCLSIPEIYEDVERPTTVVLHTQLLDGEEMTVPCGGLLARCLQHEIDHLDGVLFTDRIDEQAARAVAAQLKAIAKRERRRLKKHGSEA